MIPADQRVIISRRQRRIHVVGEVLAITLVVPFMGYLTTRRTLPTWVRLGTAAVGLGSLLLDGYVLWKFFKGERDAKQLE